MSILGDLCAHTYTHTHTNKVPQCKQQGYAQIHRCEYLHTSCKHAYTCVYTQTITCTQMCSHTYKHSYPHSNTPVYTHKYTNAHKLICVPRVLACILKPWHTNKPTQRPTYDIHVHSHKPYGHAHTYTHTHTHCTRERPRLGCLPLIIPQS